MTAIFHDPTTLDRDDPVGMANSRKPMRNHQDSASSGDPLHVCLDDSLALIIEGAGGFIEDQDARVSDERSSNRDTLPLSARQARSALTNDSIVTLREFENEIMRAGKFGRSDHALRRHARVGKRDVVTN